MDGHDVEVRADGSLLEVLRDTLGKTCVKDGCAPQGQCGACCVLVDGAPRLACVTPISRVRNREVTTVEGLSEPLRSRIADAFWRSDAFVCGFCTPGIAVRLHALLNEGDVPDRRHVDRALAAHLCRCTGWQSVVDAATTAAVPDAVADGDGHARAEAFDIVLGRHRYLADTTDAEIWAMPVCAGTCVGILDDVVGEGILTCADLGSRLPPGTMLGLGETIGDPGDIVALALGTTVAAARRTAEACRIHTRDGVPDPSPGPLDSAEWLTPVQDPGFLEPEAAFAAVDPAGLHVRTQSDRPHATRTALESAWPDRSVHLEVVTQGGSYGGKASPVPALLAAAAAEVTDRRVGFVFGRRESILWHPRRHPAKVEVDLAVHGGRLVRIDGRVVLAGGGADIGPCPYDVPIDVHVEVVAGRPAAPLRGDGLLHWTFGLEHALLDAGVGRADSLASMPSRCVAALGAADGWAVAGSHRAAVAAAVMLADSGDVTALTLAVGGGEPAHRERDIMSGAYMGLGLALSETVPMRAGVPTPGTMRSLGLLRCGDTPPMRVLEVEAASEDAVSEPVADFAVAAVPAAVAVALRLRFGDHAAVRQLPMLDSVPATRARRR